MFGKRRTFGNLVDRPGGTQGLATLGQWIAGQFDPAMTWADVEEIRKAWTGRLILKGVLDVEDAHIAASTGADAIVVSNHGGRQLDGASSTISVLGEIAAAVGDKVEVMFDGGVLSGQDVLKALALGARACLMGKGFLYALAARGEAGVSEALNIISRELSVSMALTGVNDLSQVDRRVLRDMG
jgi:L-lactate dehydrogenase (cytochrome)